MRISDWSSDVCSSDLRAGRAGVQGRLGRGVRTIERVYWGLDGKSPSSSEEGLGWWTPVKEHHPAATKAQAPKSRCPSSKEEGVGDYATVAFTILPGSRGGSPLGSASTLSMPSITSPQTVYWLSRKRASSKQMKNWLFALFGFCARRSKERRGGK